MRRPRLARACGAWLAAVAAACAAPEPARPSPPAASTASTASTNVQTIACCFDDDHRGEREGLRRGPGEHEWTARDGSVLVWVGWASFRPGAQDPGAAVPLEVSVGPLYLGKSEVTRGQYRAFCAATGRALPAARAGETDAHPITGVDWADASAYCAWAGLRLPTEAEWECAASGRGEGPYPWSRQPVEADGPRAVTADPAVLASAAAPSGAAPVGTHPGGESYFWTLDQAGNVREWVADWFAPYPPPDRRSPLADPRGPEAGAERVVRGGSWRTTDCRADTRDHAPPETRADDLGFRVACTPAR